MTRLRSGLILAAVFTVLAITGGVVMSRQALAQPSGQAKGQAPTPVSLVAPLPVPVTVSDAVHPFQVTLCDTGGTGASSCGVVPGVFTVGSDPVVVERVTGVCLANGTVDVFTAFLQTHVGSGFANHYLEIRSGIGRYQIAQDGKIYADPETNIVFGHGLAGTGNVKCEVTLSGHTLAP
jgi:hypothetical protein